MAHRAKHSEREPKPGMGAAVFSGAAVAMVVICSGGHVLVLGLLGGVALGSVLGIGVGALAAVLLAAGILVLRRRRKEAACAVSPVARASR